MANDKDSIILFLDADINRAAIYHQRKSKKDQERTFWVVTPTEAIDVLKNYRERLEVVSLEQDLKQRNNHIASEDSGMEVVRWLEKQDSNSYSHIRFIVHTWNIYAARKMVKRLSVKNYNVIYVPFGL